MQELAALSLEIAAINVWNRLNAIVVVSRLRAG
jgi:hypothetical protein